jgi:Zn-dependent membrane protease YugP
MIKNALKQIDRMMQIAKREEVAARRAKNAADVNYQAGVYCGLVSARRIICEAIKAEASE